MILIKKDEIESLITIKEVVGVVEDAFAAYARNEAEMPPKSYVTLPKGDFRAMPACISGVCGVKWVNCHPKNFEYGLPTVMALLILNNPENGLPIAIMDGMSITALRTGAAGAIAAKYMANDTHLVSLVGCGVQAVTQIMALNEVKRIGEVRLYDIKTESAEKFKREKIIDADFSVCTDIKSCVEGAEILITTTPARRPIVMNEWLSDGVHINAMGADAPGKQELDPRILKRSKIVVDDWRQASNNGEINIPLKDGIITKDDVYAELGDIIIGKKEWKREGGEITIFDSTGLAVQDIATAKLIYEEAVKEGVGSDVRLF
jgi:alanine dehydrogenase